MNVFSDENAVVTVRKRDLLPGKINGWLQVLGIQGRQAAQLESDKRNGKRTEKRRPQSA